MYTLTRTLSRSRLYSPWYALPRPIPCAQATTPNRTQPLLPQRFPLPPAYPAKAAALRQWENLYSVPFPAPCLHFLLFFPPRSIRIPIHPISLESSPASTGTAPTPLGRPAPQYPLQPAASCSFTLPAPGFCPPISRFHSPPGPQAPSHFLVRIASLLWTKMNTMLR